MPDVSMPMLYWPLMLAGAYLLGSVPFSQLLAKLNGVDLRRVGSGNVGAGNLTKQSGLAWGTAAAVLDGLKGLIPVWIAREMGFGLGAAGIVGVAAVIGHNWSFWMRGRSGRGLATSAGVLVAIDPVLMVWTTGWAIAGWKIGGGLGGFLGWGLLPLVAMALGRPPTESMVLLLLTVVILGRRMQGNADDARGRAPALKRAIYDADRDPDDYPETAEDPLTP